MKVKAVDGEQDLQFEIGLPGWTSLRRWHLNKVLKKLKNYVDIWGMRIPREGIACKGPKATINWYLFYYFKNYEDIIIGIIGNNRMKSHP